METIFLSSRGFNHYTALALEMTGFVWISSLKEMRLPGQFLPAALVPEG